MDDLQGRSAGSWGQSRLPWLSLWKIGILCVVSALGNQMLSVFISIIRAPLYLDTVFTIAITLSAGPLAGILAMLLGIAAGSAVRIHFFHYSPDLNWAAGAFTVCIIAEILLVWLFRPWIKRREALFLEDPVLPSFFGLAVQLMALMVLDCITISILGGLVDFILFTLMASPQGYNPEHIFKLGLLRNNMPALSAAILSRIPVNIVDRFIAVFGGYGLSLLYRRISNSHYTIRN